MTKRRESTESGVAVQERVRTKEPDMYKVLLLNDDYTSMEFVVLVLETVFHKNGSDAQRIMLSVHESGSGVAGVFTKEIGETKVAVVHHLARQNQFPLKCVMEPV